ncbi:DUF4848 domain-containing protein [Fulvivirga ligni]|uniref:DUF4848 domain-containing protein n=1 Tax=Fulvivirga ligni TaxID=2904246 RepID=UPI001F41A5EB|nr:DUF4848 domain-containing protein [Fulvivirga ligni]UII23742.1 DUF4848 domain-containing protein [Fulvivirga ligni]
MSACSLDQNEDPQPSFPEISVIKTNDQQMLQFRDHEVFNRSLELFKNQPEEDIVNWAADLGFKSLLARYHDFKSQIQIIENQNSSNTDFENIEAKYDEVLNKFADIITYNAAGDYERTFNDMFIASVLNPKGYVIIDNDLIKYTNKEIVSTPLDGNETDIKRFQFSKSESEARTDVFTQHCGDYYTCNCFKAPWDYTDWKYDGNVKVTKTFVPRYERRWEEGDCIEKPNGAIQCFPGHYINVIVGYTFSNTRMEATFRSKKSHCNNCDWLQYDQTHSITIRTTARLTANTPTHIESNQSNSDWYVDIATEHAQIAADFTIESSHNLEDCSTALISF